ncbi:hypothetical protein [Rhodococcus triatomae]
MSGAGAGDLGSVGEAFGAPGYTTQYGYGTTRGDVSIIYHGPSSASLGQDVTFVAELGGRPDDGPTPGNVISSVIHRAPAGFEFTGADVSSYEETPGVYPIKFLESSASVDPETGDVTVSAPAEGWTVPPKTGDGVATVNRVFVKIHYHVSKPVTEEFARSYVSFTGPDVPASDEWMETGAVYQGFFDSLVLDLGSS